MFHVQMEIHSFNSDLDIKKVGVATPTVAEPSSNVSPRLRALLSPDSGRSAFSPVHGVRYSNPDPGYSNPDPGSSKLISTSIPPIFNVFPILDVIYSNPVYSNLLHCNLDPTYSNLLYSNPAYSKLLYSTPKAPIAQTLPSTLFIPIPTDQLEESGDLPYPEKPESPYNPIPKFIIEENIVTLCSNNLCNIEIIGRMRHHPETAEPYCVPCFEYLKGMGEERDPKTNPA
uniref:DUF2039 domain-containing protein n=1 Tax=Caenorhabditis tropicalis TaxID=1561998 RepID=A0A1I7TH35_9PELO